MEGDRTGREFAGGMPVVVSEAQTARTLGVSVHTLQRLRVAGDGPVVTQLSARRIGYSVASLEAWVASRQVTSTSAATVARKRRG